MSQKNFYVGSANRRLPVGEIICSHPVSIEGPSRIEVRIPRSEEKPKFHLVVAAKKSSPLKFWLNVNGTTRINDVNYVDAGESYKIEYDGGDDASDTQAPGLAVTADVGKRVDSGSITGGRMVLKMEAKDDLLSRPVLSFEEIEQEPFGGDEWKRFSSNMSGFGVFASRAPPADRESTDGAGECTDETDGPITGRLTKVGTVQRNRTRKLQVDWKGQTLEIEITFLFV